MNRKKLSTFAVIAVLAAGVTAFAWAKEEQRSPRREDHNRLERLMEERMANLPEAEQALAKSLRPLHDSLRRVIGEYTRKVRDGADARSLVAERARITSLKSEIARLESANPEIALDLLAHLPPPGMEHRRGPKNDKSPCPMMSGDSTKPHCPRHAPPPQED
jgi:transposase